VICVTDAVAVKKQLENLNGLWLQFILWMRAAHLLLKIFYLLFKVRVLRFQNRILLFQRRNLLLKQLGLY